MSRLIVATKNTGKVAEIRALLASAGVEAVSLIDAGLELEIVEDADTFAGNALKKALAVVAATGAPALADDSGLEVDALDGQPGLHSARYGGDGLDDTGRCTKLLTELVGVVHTQRTARFRCAIAYVAEDGRIEIFEGVLEGRIAGRPSGESGFGYNPVFIPEGENRSIAELGPAHKNRISHRARALAAFAAWFVENHRV